jgi:hypothetical protein
MAAAAQRVARVPSGHRCPGGTQKDLVPASCWQRSSTSAALTPSAADTAVTENRRPDARGFEHAAGPR